MARSRLTIVPGVSVSRRRAQRGTGGTSGIFYEGSFFDTDPTATFAANKKRLMDRVATIGEAEVKRRIAGAPRKSAGPSYSGQFIDGRTHSLRGREWVATAVISANVSTLNQAKARRVQATLAGRHKAQATLTYHMGVKVTKHGKFVPIRVADNTRNIGTTRGHEGNAKVFAKTRTSLARKLRENAKILTEGLA